MLRLYRDKPSTKRGLKQRTSFSSSCFSSWFIWVFFTDDEFKVCFFPAKDLPLLWQIQESWCRGSIHQEGSTCVDWWIWNIHVRRRLWQIFFAVSSICDFPLFWCGPCIMPWFIIYNVHETCIDEEAEAFHWLVHAIACLAARSFVCRPAEKKDGNVKEHKYTLEQI